MIRLSFVILIAALAPGCALIDALGDDDEPPPCPVDDPGCDPQPGPQATCGTPFPLGVVDVDEVVDTCRQGQTGSSDCPGAGNGGDMVLEFEVEAPASYELCLDVSPTSLTTVSRDPCDDSGKSPEVLATCLPGPGCDTLVLVPGRHYIHWQSGAPPGPDGAGDCGDMRVTIRKLPDLPVESGPECFDAFDNNDNGLVDCEEDSCKDEEALCQVGAIIGTGEPLCDGRNDGSLPGLPDAAVDELACGCVVDVGCDDINTGSNDKYICHHIGLLNGEGVCGPDCRAVNWCMPLGLTCDVTLGYCL